MIEKLLLAAAAVVAVILASRAAWAFLDPWGDSE